MVINSRTKIKIKIEVGLVENTKNPKKFSEDKSTTKRGHKLQDRIKELQNLFEFKEVRVFQVCLV